jgi:hypothetical protein
VSTLQLPVYRQKRMNDIQANPRFDELIQEVEEDGEEITATAARTRLDRLVESGKARRTSAATRGLPICTSVLRRPRSEEPEPAVGITIGINSSSSGPEHVQESPYLLLRRGGRAVECGGLENR